MFFFDLRCLFQSFQQILSSLTNFILAIRILSKTRCFKNLSNRNQEQKGLTHIALLLSFDQNKFFFSKNNTVLPIMYFMIILMIFTKKILLDLICVFYQVFFKRQYSLTSAIVSSKGFWMVLTFKLKFNISHYSTTALWFTSFHDMAAWTFLKETRGRNRIT